MVENDKKSNEVSFEELKKYKSTIGTLQDRTEALLCQQKATWQMAHKNFDNLKKVKTKQFDFANSSIIAQFNPERIRSSSAKVDEKSIAKRECFLCSANLPHEQKYIRFYNKFFILVNPFPIFEKHFTICSTEHEKQLINNKFEHLLDVSKELSQFVIFYNGSQCGASAPDHFHFQAGNRGFLPIENEYDKIVKTKGEIISRNDNCKVIAVSDCMRKFISFESSKKNLLIQEIGYYYDKMNKINPNLAEPMMNILAYFTNGMWRIIIFPRGKHRPRQFFAQNESQIMLSPASVDFGGVCIIPRLYDFNKITKEDIADIFSQVTVDDVTFDRIKS